MPHHPGDVGRNKRIRSAESAEELAHSAEFWPELARRAEGLADVARNAETVREMFWRAQRSLPEEAAAPAAPLEARIKEWAGPRRHRAAAILLFLAGQSDRTASLASIGKHVYRRRMAGAGTENNRRTVARQLRILARNPGLSQSVFPCVDSCWVNWAGSACSNAQKS
jgi:hypothetical protein